MKQHDAFEELELDPEIEMDRQEKEEVLALALRKAGVRPRRRRKGVILLAAALVAAASAATAFASHSSWELFASDYGNQYDVVRNYVSSQEQSVTSNGITITLRGIVGDREHCALRFDAAEEGGQRQFEERGSLLPKLTALHPSSESGSGQSSGTRSTGTGNPGFLLNISNDYVGKTGNMEMTITSLFYSPLLTEEIGLNPLPLLTDEFVQEEQMNCINPGSKAKLESETTFKADEYDTLGGDPPAQLPKAQEEGIPVCENVTLSSAAFADGKLYLRTTQPANSRVKLCRLYPVDRRTGMIPACYEYQTRFSLDPPAPANLPTETCYIYDIGSLSELEHYQFKIAYFGETQEITGEWTFSHSFTESPVIVPKQTPPVVIELEDKSEFIVADAQVEFTPISMMLRFSKDSLPLSKELERILSCSELYFVRKDGREIKTLNGSCSASDENSFAANIMFEATDPNDIAKIVIRHTSYSYSYD